MLSYVRFNSRPAREFHVLLNLTTDLLSHHTNPIHRLTVI